MTRVRALAFLTIGVLLVYHMVRLISEDCSGPGCEWFIPISLYLPLTAFSLAIITGVRAYLASEARSLRRAILAVSIAISGIGPFGAIVVLRNNPDLVVPIATVLLLVAPVAALVEDAVDRRRSRPNTEAVV